MPRRKVTTSIADRIARLARQGKAPSAIASACGVSLRTAQRYVREFVGGQRSPRANGAQRGNGAAHEPSVIEPMSSDPLVEVDAVLAELAAMRRSAVEAGNLPVEAQAQRLRLAALSLRARHTPPPPVEPADNSSYMAAAQQAITRLERTLDRALKRRAKWPVCEECGCHVRPPNDPERDLSPAQRWAAVMAEILGS